MKKEKLNAANKLDGEIDWVKYCCLDSIEKLANSDKKLSLTNHYNSVRVPDDLSHIFIALLKDYYETALHELEQEFDEI